MTSTLCVYDVHSVVAERLNFKNVIKFCTVMKNNLKLFCFVLLSVYPQGDIVNKETCRNSDEFKLISRKCTIIDRTLIINNVIIQIWHFSEISSNN
jgi:hypothetical protein